MRAPTKAVRVGWQRTVAKATIARRLQWSEARGREMVNAEMLATSRRESACATTSHRCFVQLVEVAPHLSNMPISVGVSFKLSKESHLSYIYLMHFLYS